MFLLCISLWCIYHINKAVQIVEGADCGSLYHAIWCAETLYIASLHMWFESDTNERTMYSKSGIYTLQVEIAP